MRIPLFKQEDFFIAAFCFEASLILLALLLGWAADIAPFSALHLTAPALLYGVVGSIPLFLMFLGLERLQNNAVVDIRNLLMTALGVHLHRYEWPHWLALAAIAGLSEEVLFRGMLQPWLETVGGAMVGLVVSNLIFGLVHAVTPLYALLATLVGLYLGWSMDFGGERNLLTPVLIHALYDFLAFVALMRAYRANLASNQ